MEEQKIICYAVFSEETADFLTLALTSDKSKTFGIVGFVTNNVERKDLNFDQLRIITSLQEFLFILGGEETDINLLEEKQIFRYTFMLANKQGPLEWFASCSELNLTYDELKSTAEEEEDYYFSFSSKTYSELVDLISPAEEMVFQGIKDRLIRRGIINTEIITTEGNKRVINAVVGLADETLLLALNDGSLEVWNLETDSYKNINLYGELEENIVVKLEVLFTNPTALDAKFVALTQKGDVFVVYIKGDYFPEVQKIDLPDKARFITVNKSTILAGLINGGIEFIDGTSLLRLQHFISGVAIFAKVKKNVLTAIVYKDSNYHVKRWDVNTLELIESINLGNTPITSLIVMIEQILVSTNEGEIKIIASELKKMEIENINNIRTMVRVPNFKRILVFPKDGVVEVLTLPDELNTLENSDRYSMSTLLFVGAGQVVIGAKTGEIEIFNTETGKMEYVLQQLPDLSTRSELDSIVGFVILGKNKIASVNKAGKVIIWK
jgi:hypothetical protein